jgi:hypothetical protein
VRVLFLGAGPSDKERIRLDREFRAIKERLSEASNRGRELELVAEWAVRPADLSRTLLAATPDVVHFAGHGGSAGIFLEDEAGNSHPVSTRSLADLFDVVGRSVRCIVLNACHTAEHAGALVEVVDTVVGTYPDIVDSVAIAFAAGFHRALGHGLSVGDAFRLGRNEIDLLALGGSQIPQLLSRSGVDPGTVYPQEPTPASGATSTEAVANLLRSTPAPPLADDRLSVFVSKPNTMTPEQLLVWTQIKQALLGLGLRPRTVGDTDFPGHSPLVDVVALLRQCNGALVLGFSQLQATDALLYRGTPKERREPEVRLATAWNQMEASMAFSLGLPLLLVREDGVREEGMLDRGSLPLFIHSTDLSPAWAESQAFQEPLGYWVGEVRHHADRDPAD